MAIRLLSHLWRAATPSSALEPGDSPNDWGIEVREPSPWNPRSEATTVASWPPIEQRPPDSIWAETQPCCHD